jgi:hypothetical protein
MRKVLCAALMIAAVLPGVALAQAGQRGEATARAGGGQPREIGKFDVAGVRLGMTYQEAKDILTAKGFAMRDTAFGRWDYNTLIAQEASRRGQPIPAFKAPADVPDLTGTDAAGNRVEVVFASMRTGPEVATIRLFFSSKSNDLAALPHDIVQRYGRPTQSTTGNVPIVYEWCERRNQAGSCPPSFEPGVRMTFETAFGPQIELTDWVAKEEQRKAEIAAMFAAPTADRQRSLIGS